MFTAARSADRRLITSTALALCLSLSACGGDGAYGVASTPPPPTTPSPTPTPSPALPAGTTTYNYPPSTVEVRRSWLDAPATRLGSYDLIGRLTTGTANVGSPSNRQASPGEFTMIVANATGGRLSYSVTAPAGILPAGATTSNVGSPQISWDINSTVAYRYTNTYGDTPQYLGEHLAGFGGPTQLFSYDYTRGSSSFGKPIDAQTYARTTLNYDVGDSYVAMGEWSWGVFDNTSGKLVPGTGYGWLLFVNGDRTPSAGIPASGTATYDARTFFGWVNAPFSLVADFGQRTMSANIAQDYRYNPAGDSMDNPLAFGIHVSGTAPFSNEGLFNIPLSGTVNWADSYAVNTPLPPSAETVTGLMNGAFFGPHAEQVGGTLSLSRANGNQVMQDAFIGQQRP